MRKSKAERKIAGGSLSGVVVFVGIASLACGGDGAAPTVATPPAPSAGAVPATPAALTVSPNAPWAGVDLLTAPADDWRSLKGARITESDDDHVRILLDSTGEDNATQRLDTYRRILAPIGFEPRFYDVGPGPETYGGIVALARGEDVVALTAWLEGEQTWVTLQRSVRPAPSVPLDEAATFASAMDDAAAIGERISCAMSEAWTFRAAGSLHAEALGYEGSGTWAREGADLVTTLTYVSDMEGEEANTSTTRLAGAQFYGHGSARWLVTTEGTFACAFDLEIMDGVERPSLAFVLDAGGGPARAEQIARILASQPGIRVSVGSTDARREGVVVAWRAEDGAPKGPETSRPGAAYGIGLASMIEPYGEPVHLESWREAPHPTVVLVGTGH